MLVVEAEIENKDSSPDRLDPPESLASRVVGLTNNIIATALVVMIALLFGTLLVSQYRPEADANESSVSLLDAWPRLETCALEFGDSPFQIQRTNCRGSASDVGKFLQDACRLALEQGARPDDKVGDAEQRLLSKLVDRHPVETSTGKWRIFHVRGKENSLVPQVVGIRDNCEASKKTGENDEKSRLVVWGMAIPTGEDQWTTFVGQVSRVMEQFGLPEKLIPGNVTRTISMSDPGMAGVVGFVGGSVDELKNFYQQLAEDQAWKVVNEWKQLGNDWNARYQFQSDKWKTGIQVHLVTNHNETSGLITIQRLN